MSRRASSRKGLWRRIFGNPPRARETGHWSDVPSRRDLILRRSNWRRTIGSQTNSSFCRSVAGYGRSHRQSADDPRPYRFKRRRITAISIFLFGDIDIDFTIGHSNGFRPTVSALVPIQSAKGANLLPVPLFIGCFRRERAIEDPSRHKQYRRYSQQGFHRFHTMSFAAISPPPAIRIAAMAIVALGLAKPARIRNAVESSGVA